MAMEGGRCAALRVDRGRREFVCTVYERRPALCRELERGSPQCQGERDLKAERPARLLAVLVDPLHADT